MTATTTTTTSTTTTTTTTSSISASTSSSSSIATPPTPAQSLLPPLPLYYYHFQSYHYCYNQEEEYKSSSSYSSSSSSIGVAYMSLRSRSRCQWDLRQSGSSLGFPVSISGYLQASGAKQFLWVELFAHTPGDSLGLCFPRCKSFVFAVVPRASFSAAGELPAGIRCSTCRDPQQSDPTAASTPMYVDTPSSAKTAACRPPLWAESSTPCQQTGRRQ